MLDFLFTLSGLWMSLLLLFAFLGVTILGYLVYSGLWVPVEVDAKEPSDDLIPSDGLTIAYKTLKGPYKNCGTLFSEAICTLPKNRTIGIYYDDPEVVPSKDLRFAVGSVLTGSDADVKEKEMKEMLAAGFKIFHIPKPAYAVMSSFPFITTMSIYIAIFRVYPKIKQYISSKGLCAYPAIEQYTESEIKFIMPLSRQEEYYVPEFCEDQVSIATTEMSSVAESSQNYQKDLENSDIPKNEDVIFLKPRTPSISKSKQRAEDLDESKKSEDETDNSEASSFEDLGAVGKEELVDP